MTSDDKQELETTDEQEGTDVQTRPKPYIHEPFYKDLLEKYQDADWEASAQLIDQLLEKYPDDPSLLEFQREVNVRQLLHSGNQAIEKEEKQEETRKWIIRSVIALAVVAVIFFAVRFAVNMYQSDLAEAQQARTATAVANLLERRYRNAEGFMESGRFESAYEEYQIIYEIDPEYENVQARLVEAEEMMALEDLYQQGVQLYDNGEIEEALEIFREVQSKVPNYRTTTLLINEIEGQLEIQRLIDEAKQAFEDEEWQTVVDNYNTIISIDGSADVSAIEEELFESFIELIFETADRPDATIEDVEKAEAYYRTALSIFPQNRDFRVERQELERVVKNLLSNKFFLYAMELIEVDDYSVASLEEAIKMLNKAKNLGSSSPAIESEITNATLYLDAFDDFVNKRWENAIDNLEQLNRIEPDYANGIVKFLLYEAYTARGDTLYTFADYANARIDYEEAAKFAYGESGNTLQLFQIEVRIGFALRRLTSIQEAAAYFDHAANIVSFTEKAAGNDTLEDTIARAQFSYSENDYWNAVRLYEIALEDSEVIYEFENVAVSRSDSIAHIAFRYGSTVEAIREFNELGDSMVARSDGELVVPVLPEDQE